MQGLDVGRSLYFPTLQVYPVHEAALGLKGREDKEQKRSDSQLIYAAVIPVVARGLLLIFVHLKKASPLSVLHTAQLKHREDVWVVFHRIHRRVEETQCKGEKYIHPHPLLHAHMCLDNLRGCRPPCLEEGSLGHPNSSVWRSPNA